MAVQTVEGGVKFHSVIQDVVSPHQFTYEVDLPDGTSVTEYDDDSMIFFGPDGEHFASVAQPWAVDATGKSVPTTLDWTGSSIIQTVSIPDGLQVTYPIVADPYAGKALFQNWFYEPRSQQYNNQGRYSASKTAFGQRIHNGQAGDPAGWVGGVAAGQGIMRNEGWAEWTSKWPSLRTARAAMYQQYSCHVLGGFHNLAGTSWDLEVKRPDNPTWLIGVGSHRCNW